ncbi:MAG: BatD family protein, partial [Planctomycetes bacterium]|nr:BatD family protein [Planctomycetota bacterium]
MVIKGTPFAAAWLVILLSTISAQSRARITRVLAQFDPPTLVLEEVGRYVIQVHLSANDPRDLVELDAPILPAVDGLTIEYEDRVSQRGSSGITINGRHTGESYIITNFIFRVTPKKLGRLVIPAFNYVGAKGVEAQIPAADCSVDDEAPGNRFVSLIVSCDRPRPYVNQPVTMRFELLTEKPFISRGARFDVPWVSTPNGFASAPVEPIGRGAVTLTVALNGEMTQVPLSNHPRIREGQRVVIERTLYPLAPGKVELGRSTASLEMALRTRRRVFDIEVLESTRATVTSEPLVIEVRDAPMAGRPKSFAGAIGDLVCQVRYGDPKIRAGDGVTLTLEVVGKGGLESLPLPELTEFADFDVY